MSRHLLLRGGPVHDFAATSAALASALEEQGLVTTMVDHPDDLVAELRAVESGAGEPVALVTVNALRWGMAQERYASQRAEFAHRLTDEDAAVLDRFVRGGGGLLALHTAVICFDGHPTWRALCGAAWSWDVSGHPPVGPVSIRLTAAGRGHEVTAGIDDFVVEDEAYGFLDEEDGIEALLTSSRGGRDHPVVWAREVGGGRVVTDLLGHGPASLAHPAHRRLLVQAAAWARRDRRARASERRP